MVSVTIPNGDIFAAKTVDERLWDNYPTVRLFAELVTTQQIISGQVTPAHIFVNATVDYAGNLKSAKVRIL